MGRVFNKILSSNPVNGLARRVTSQFGVVNSYELTPEERHERLLKELKILHEQVAESKKEKNKQLYISICAAVKQKADQITEVKALLRPKPGHFFMDAAKLVLDAATLRCVWDKANAMADSAAIKPTTNDDGSER